MLPPPPAAETLAANPKFAALYHDLTTVVLDPADASTRVTAAKHHDVDQELRTLRAEAAKSHLLRSELDALAGRGTSTLGEEALEILDLFSSPFYRELGPRDRALLHDDAEELEDALPALAHAVSASLIKAAKEIAGVAHPADSASTLLHRVDTLPGNVAHRLHTLARSRAQLTASLGTLSSTLSTLLDAHKTLSAQLLQGLTALEGQVAPAVRTRAEHLALVAESMSLKLGVLRGKALEAIYDDEAVGALENYAHHLRDTTTRLKARERVVATELEKYGKAGGEMRVLVERYVEAAKRAESIRSDVRRLGGEA